MLKFLRSATNNILGCRNFKGIKKDLNLVTLLNINLKITSKIH